jgi:hypothetical protein
MNEEQTNTKAQGIGIINLVAGMWLILSPFLLGYSQGAMANSVLIGIAVAIIAIIRLAMTRDAWTGWLVAAIGLWLIIAPFVFGFTEPAVLWNEIIVGIIIAGLSLWRGIATTPLHTPHQQHPTM